MMKRVMVHLRTSIKLIVLISIIAIMICAALIYIFKPIYSVTLNGEFIGYSQNKSKLQNKINDYMKNGGDDNVAFVQIDELPEYELCLLKKNNVSNDEEIFNKVIATGTKYYEYYAITVDDKEKKYVASYNDAKDAIDQLKKKKSSNIDKIGMIKKYSTELKEFSEVKTVVSDLYVAPIVKTVANYSYATTSSSGTKTVNLTNKKPDLNMSIIRPISGTITSRYGYRRTGLHTGLDIAAPKGTPIKVVSSGTVKFAGRTSSGYGIHVIVTHGNGIETYYAHCSKVYVKAGQKVNQGEVIAAVGSTGNSTGPHLHLEIRINGQCQNPQNYLY